MSTVQVVITIRIGRESYTHTISAAGTPQTEISVTAARFDNRAAVPTDVGGLILRTAEIIPADEV